MLSTEEQVKLADLMERHELAVSSLYKAFAKRFPEHKGVWQRLAGAEIAHAEQIHAFKGRIRDGDVRLDAAHQRALGQLEQSLTRISSEVGRTERGHNTLADAVDFARQVEHAMLENNWFECYQGDSDLIKRVLDALSSETRKHSEEMDRLFERVGGGKNRKEPREEGPGVMQRLPEE